MEGCVDGGNEVLEGAEDRVVEGRVDFGDVVEFLLSAVMTYEHFPFSFSFAFFFYYFNVGGLAFYRVMDY